MKNLDFPHNTYMISLLRHLKYLEEQGTRTVSTSFADLLCDDALSSHCDDALPSHCDDALSSHCDDALPSP